MSLKGSDELRKCHHCAANQNKSPDPRSNLPTPN